MENAAGRVHSHLQLNHTESTRELTLSIRLQTGAYRQTRALHSHDVTCLLSRQGFIYAFIPGELPFVFLSWPETDDVNLFDGGSAISPAATISIKPKPLTDIEKCDV